ncbi:hypothetical protein JCM30394_27760 [Deferrisoma palaeochoriense]
MEGEPAGGRRVRGAEARGRITGARLAGFPVRPPHPGPLPPAGERETEGGPGRRRAHPLPPGGGRGRQRAGRGGVERTLLPWWEGGRGEGEKEKGASREEAGNRPLTSVV